MPPLYTERLILSPLSPEDWPDYCRLYRNPVTMRHILAPYSQERARETFKQMQTQQENGQRLNLAIRLRQNQKFTGITGLVFGAEQEAEIGIMLCPEACGQGLGNEAIPALSQLGFDQYGLKEILARYRPENAAAKRLFIRQGFKPDKELTETPYGSMQYCRLNRIANDNLRICFRTTGECRDKLFISV